MWSRLALATLVVLALILEAHGARAFCGFYVSGADAKLSNDASMVVLMRSGNRTVLSMQNDYEGPPQDFALVVPVPVVLQKENVKTLSKQVFDHIDSLSAPRLVEYWEQDPCAEEDDKEGGTGTRAKGEEGSMGKAYGIMGPSVTIEAQFAVGEYEIVILSAKDSGGLDAWLREEHYKIPEGAEPVLRPYVAAGSKFFVAKVDVKKVRFEGGRLKLSPLRFHYDSESFSLPVRLGLLNSTGTQDLIVNILAPSRFEVANYPNVRIPTNIDVADSVRLAFPQFYATLFDRTLAKNPRAVVTEYAWQATGCDPCPVPPVEESDVRILGGDVAKVDPYNLTLTRLHARYTKDALGDDLVFKVAEPIEGGREGGGGASGQNNFQARYVIRHAWSGPVRCKYPNRDSWGGPPGGARSTTSAKDLATTPRGAPLESMIRSDVPQLGIANAAPDPGRGLFRFLRGLGVGGGLGIFAVAIAVVLGRRKGHG